MPDLLLHIGHMKTGTTWLQDAFRDGAAALGAAGIRYPLVADAAPGLVLDRDTRVPCGNGRAILADPAPEVAAARIAEATGGADRTALFSSEILFEQLTEPARDLATLPQAARRAGFGRVRVLLFTRAPAPLAASIWQQRLRNRWRETRDLDEWTRAVFDWPEKVADLVGRLDRTDGIEVRLMNYDVHRGDLLAPVEAWLGVAPGTVPRPAQTTANRSLTRAETALLVALNRRLDARDETARNLAFGLTNRLPDVPRDAPRLSPGAAQGMLDRQATALDRIDAALPAGEALSRALPEPAGGPLTLGPDQLDVLAEVVARSLARAPEPPAPAWRRAARALRRGSTPRRRPKV